MRNNFKDTLTSGFFKEGSLIGNLDGLTNDQLKERLLVAEALMKKLYNRNKDVELYHKQKQESALKPLREKSQDNQSDESIHELDMIAEFKKREE